MNLEELRQQHIRQELGISAEYGRMLAVIDFGNVNNWFDDDRFDTDHVALAHDTKLAIDLKGLKDFASVFSNDTRFYYGHDADHAASIGFLTATRNVFGKSRVFTKPIQKIRHQVTAEEMTSTTRLALRDGDGFYVQIPKCNFDVEIAVDTIRLRDTYDTLVLFSGDADFVSLARFLRRHDKRVIIVKGGYITASLRREADLVVNAQEIKRYITMTRSRKQKPGL